MNGGWDYNRNPWNNGSTPCTPGTFTPNQLGLTDLTDVHPPINGIYIAIDPWKCIIWEKHGIFIASELINFHDHGNVIGQRGTVAMGMSWVSHQTYQGLPQVGCWIMGRGFWGKSREYPFERSFFRSLGIFGICLDAQCSSYIRSKMMLYRWWIVIQQTKTQSPHRTGRNPGRLAMTMFDRPSQWHLDSDFIHPEKVIIEYWDVWPTFLMRSPGCRFQD